jgi:hypothetical protein
VAVASERKQEQGTVVGASGASRAPRGTQNLLTSHFPLTTALGRLGINHLRQAANQRTGIPECGRPARVSRRISDAVNSSNDLVACIEVVQEMAAFCGCCGVEITGKPETCPDCGTPRHGMFKTSGEVALDFEGDPFQAHIEKPVGSATPVPLPPDRHCCRSSGAPAVDDEMKS